MPTLHPTSLDNLDDIPHSEREVFEKLKSLDDSYYIYHSVTWSGTRDGECDFIIFHRDRGFIALEVKGGEIEQRDGKWYSISRKGDINTIKNPVSQAQRSMRALRDIYGERYGSFRGIYSWAVCFPDVEWTEAHFMPDLNEHTVLDASSLDRIAEWAEDHLSWRSGKHKGALMLHQDAENFLSLMNRDIMVPLSIRRAIEMQEQELQRVNLMQKYLLDLFEDKDRIGFQGAAGTGKTWIAMKKAKRLAASGSRVLFLCYNRPVNDFIQKQLRDEDIVTVSTFHSFSYSVIRDYLKKHMNSEDCLQCFSGCITEIIRSTVPDPETVDDIADDSSDELINSALYSLSKLPKSASCGMVLDDYRSRLPEAVSEIVSNLLPNNDDFFADRVPLTVMVIFENDQDLLEQFRFDGLIIDEAQDFHRNWCECLKYLFKKYGERICYIFYDDNQTIFTREPELPVTGLISSTGLENHIFRLRENLRNTKNIHDFAVEKSGKGSTAMSLDIPGLEPVEVSFDDEGSVVKWVGDKLGELIEDHRIGQENIVVLSNRSIDHSIFSKNKKVGGYTLIPKGEGVRPKTVRFRTIQQFKGLESDVVVLVIHRRPEDADERFHSDELLYVGYTRAKHLLYVVGVGVTSMF